MKIIVWRWISILSAASVLAYAGTIAITDIKGFALWRINILGFLASIFALRMCQQFEQPFDTGVHCIAIGFQV